MPLPRFRLKDRYGFRVADLEISPSPLSGLCRVLGAIHNHMPPCLRSPSAAMRLFHFPRRGSRGQRGCRHWTVLDLQILRSVVGMLLGSLFVAGGSWPPMPPPGPRRHVQPQRPVMKTSKSNNCQRRGNDSALPEHQKAKQRGMKAAWTARNCADCANCTMLENAKPAPC